MLGRGLQANRDDLVKRLQAVSYYRLSQYLYPYRKPGSDDFQSATTLDLVWQHYVFDRQLRFLVMEEFIDHFKTKYGDEHDHLPIWMLIEVMSFGKTLTFFRGVDRSVQQEVAANFRVPNDVFVSWLFAFNTVRNICAHHGRLWK